MIQSIRRKRVVKKLLDPDRISRIYIYIRCSHQDSADSGLGLAEQEELCRAFIPVLERKLGRTFEFGGVFKDAAQSAFKRRFLQRPEAFRLNKLLQTGDQVLIPRIDRGFRNTKDCLEMVDRWTDQGIGVQFVTEGIDVQHYLGRFFLEIMAAFAQYQSAYIGARGKETASRLRKEGRPISRINKRVFDVHGPKRHRVLTLKPAYTHVGALVAHYYDVQKITSWREISEIIEEAAALRENRPKLENKAGRLFTPHACCLAYYAYKRSLGEKFGAFDASIDLEARQTFEPTAPADPQVRPADAPRALPEVLTPAMLDGMEFDLDLTKELQLPSQKDCT
jgi:DNA invertase Pin-like site-specific DNA recombinase